VHGLRHDPVPGGHDDPVRGQQADAYRCGKPDECEYPCVEQHETLRGRVHDPAWLGHDQREDDHQGACDQGRHDLGHVLANRSLRSGTRTLTAARTAGGGWHALTSSGS
jgi:hypothetical protein